MDQLEKDHFDPKAKCGWDLDFSLLVHDVFYEAFGENLESYLIHEIIKRKNYGLRSGIKPNQGLMLYKLKRKTK
jgi:hypothetical protein